MSRRKLLATTTRITVLARAGALATARNLFDEMPGRDTVAWNAILSAYSHSSLPHETLSLLSSMRLSGAQPDPFTLTASLSASAAVRDPFFGRALHALALCSGLKSSLPVANCLVDMYGKCRLPSDAQKAFEEIQLPNGVSCSSLLHGLLVSGLVERARDLFDEMPVRNVVTWNVMIMGYGKLGKPESAIGLLKRMVLLGLRGDVSTFVNLMNACSEMAESCFGLMIYGFIIKIGWGDATEVGNSVVSFYAKFGCRDDAFKVFDSMGVHSLVSWNAMIDACMKAGDVEGAVLLFRSAPEINEISCTSMIGGFAKNGHGEEALVAFVDMMRSDHRPDEFTFGAVLQACAILAVLGNGRMAHGCATRCGVDNFVYVGNGLVNMYAKCGGIEESSKVFNGIAAKDLVSWNAMIFGFAMHGWAMRALKVYKDMVVGGVSPDKVTFIGLLMACSHSGLVKEGKVFFEMMEEVYGVPPDVDHVTCIIDMLGRAGQVREASELAEGYSDMSREGTRNSLEAVLSACALHSDVRIGRKVGEELVNAEPQKEVGYVMLSNLYCVSGQWREAERVRRAMVEQGVKKAPGCSWIEVRDMVRVFVTGSQSLAHMLDVHKMLGLLKFEMRNPSPVCLNKEL